MLRLSRLASHRIPRLTLSTSQNSLTQAHQRQYNIFSRVATQDQKHHKAQKKQEEEDEEGFDGIEAKPKEEKLKTPDQINKNIYKLQKNISEMTRTGMNLSRRVAKEITPDSYLKVQRFNQFLSRMEDLYKFEKNSKRRKMKRYDEMEKAIVHSMTPLKSILRVYNEISRSGFDPESMALALENVKRTKQARGWHPRVMQDYTDQELEQSWRMQQVCDQLKEAISRDIQDTYTGGQMLPPYHFQKIINNLGDIGYKNTDLMEYEFDKILHMLKIEKDEKREIKSNYNLQDYIYGSYQNFIPRHYVFQGFQNSEEFSDYVKTLVEWEEEKNKSYIALLNQQEGFKSLDEEVKELHSVIGEIVDSVQEVKGLQKEVASSIDSLRSQYFLMQEAVDQHQFLLENPYIKYDLLELQEKLVTAGYLLPEEETSMQRRLSEESFESKMNRATQIFYDYVTDYHPEFLSSTINKYYSHSNEILSRLQGEKESDAISIAEQNNTMNVENLSKCLVGLAKQALSIRRDVVNKDYPHEFYQKYLMPEESGHEFDPDLTQKNEHVKMEREYLKAWKIFKQRVAEIEPFLTQKIRNVISGQEQGGLKAIFNGFRGLNEARIWNNELRQEMLDYCVESLNKMNLETLETTLAIEGLLGMATNPFQSLREKQMGYHLASSIKDISHLTFSERVELLWSICALEAYGCDLTKQLIDYIDKPQYERVQNELSYIDYKRLIDIHNALRIEGSKTGLQISNKHLLVALFSKDIKTAQKYHEDTLYDPFKFRIVHGITKGLTSASIDHQSAAASNVIYQSQQETDTLLSEQYPYPPDIVLGFQGEKIGAYVLTEKDLMLDTNTPNGVQTFRMRLVEKANKESPIKTITIAVPKVVTYDLENLQIKFNSSYNLSEDIKGQVGYLDNIEDSLNRSFEKFTQVCSQIVSNTKSFFNSSQVNEAEKTALEKFILKIQDLYEKKQQASLKFNKPEQSYAYNQLRIGLMKAHIAYENLPQKTKMFVDQFGADFKEALVEIKDSTPKLNSEPIKSAPWVGKRLSLEFPIGQEKKDIVPEIINQRFMWVEDYFHYPDWKDMLRATFDNFNLMVIPTDKNKNKYFLDRTNHQRRIPKGVFPSPSKKRELFWPEAHTFTNFLNRSPQYDPLSMFENEPMKLMVYNELKQKNQTQELTPQVSMIANLQNIKQCLKSDYADRQLLQVILLNLDFTEKLIEEHLVSKYDQPSGELLPRDCQAYRNFIYNSYYSKDREDPFTEFYLREGAKNEKVEQLYEHLKRINKQMENYTREDERERMTRKMEEIQDQIDEQLMANQRENQDIGAFTFSLRRNIVVNYDLKSLMNNPPVFEIDAEVADEALSAEEFLDLSRRRAETKLIKTKIIYKLYTQLEPLTENEKAYLKAWTKDLQKNRRRNVGNLKDSMVPKKTTRLTINDMSADSMYVLNSLSRVELNREMHGKFSLNDLILELGHFIDTDVQDKVSLNMFEDRLKKEWDLSADFKLVNSYNKEPGLIRMEMEELAYRSAGQFDEQDKSNIKRLLSVKRNKDDFDKVFFDLDMRSFDEFIEDANNYDDRMLLLDKWIRRKEDEYQKRIALPPSQMRKTDKELHRILDKDYKIAREKMVAKLLSEDEYGNKLDKNYHELTSRELGIISYNMALRLPLFNYQYPEFLEHMIKAIIEHPNIQRSDRDHLEAFCKMFELDWQGERASQKNSDKFLFEKPVHLQGDNFNMYADIDREKFAKMLKGASADYISEVRQGIQQTLA